MYSIISANLHFVTLPYPCVSKSKTSTALAGSSFECWVGVPLHGAGDLGAASFGSERGDAILPGIDWAIGREWTSGDNGFRDPWSMPAVPPVDSVTIPTMVVSRDSVFRFLPS